MTDMDDARLRALLRDEPAERPDPAFAAAVLARLGARRRRRRGIVALLLGAGTLGPIVILAAEAARAAAAPQAGLGILLVAVVLALAALALRTSPSRRAH